MKAYRPNQITGKNYILDSPGLQTDFFQFIPATVTGVVNSAESVINPNLNAGESNLITINKKLWTTDVSTRTSDKQKYKPLIRGFADSIVVGDVVLVTYINGDRFYLGPINSKNSLC